MRFEWDRIRCQQDEILRFKNRIYVPNYIDLKLVI